MSENGTESDEYAYEGFVTDAMLGKLTTYMRMAGYDVLYAPDEGAVDDDEVARLAEETNRKLITRDVELSESADGLLLGSKDVEEQLRELSGSGMGFSLREPSRCSACNGELSEVGSEGDRDGGETEGKGDSGGAGEGIPGDVGRAWRCDDCGKVYWKGSHWDDVRETFGSVTR